MSQNEEEGLCIAGADAGGRSSVEVASVSGEIGYENGICWETG